MIVAILFIAILLTVAYVLLMLAYRKGWDKQPYFVIAKDYIPQTKISIIIPARDEEKNIGKCLEAILKQDYPKDLFEVIVVDDHSTDATAAIVEGLKKSNVKCVRMADHDTGNTIAYKKKALSLGITHSTGELIVTTDADCFMDAQWLKHIAAVYEEQEPVMIVAPVDFAANGSIVQVFQSLDFLSMQGITAASHKLNLGNMSNGANLAFSRKAFDVVKGYEGIDHLASGDDFLLMMKLKTKYPNQVGYLKSQEAIVCTLPQPTWGSFLQQRIRWASKSGKYNDIKLTVVLMLVYLFNLSFLVLTVAGFVDPFCWIIMLAILVLKTEVELFYLYPVAKFFGKRKLLLIFPLLQPLHIGYIILAGLLGFIGVYRWKGRTVR